MPGLFSTPESDLREACGELLGAEARLGTAQRLLPGSHPARNDLLRVRTQLLYVRLELSKELDALVVKRTDATISGDDTAGTDEHNKRV